MRNHSTIYCATPLPVPARSTAFTGLSDSGLQTTLPTPPPSTHSARMSSPAPAPITVPIPNARWHEACSTSTRTFLRTKLRPSAGHSSSTSPRPNTSSFATAPLPSHRKTVKTLPPSVAHAVGKSPSSSTTTTRNTTFNLRTAVFLSKN